jgi:hypothetical protein
MSISISEHDLALANFDENFTRAVITLLEEQGIDIAVQTGDGGNMPESSIEVVFGLGPSTNKGKNCNGDIVDDYFVGSNLTLTIRTYRPLDQAALVPGILRWHSELAAKIRCIFQPHREAFTHDLLPYYRVKFMRPIGTRHFVDQEFEQDCTTITFEFEFAIPPEAWAE